MMQLVNETDSVFNTDFSLRGSIDYGTVSPATASPTPPIISYGVAVLLGVLETLIAMGAVVGNILVIASVYTNRKLRTITNLFVVSLAFSDLMVGLLVLPFSIKIQVTNRWNLGGIVCEIYITLDVLLCTASILNLCCISLDRYFAITRPLACATKRSKRLALLMIAAVWVLSLIITIPPLLGWKDEDRLKNGIGSKECDLIQEQNYVIYSALGSFYIPLAIMLFVYANIFVVARNAQIRWRNSSSKGASMRSSRPGSSPSSPVATLNRGGDEEKRGAVSPRAMRVTSTASDAVCCGCFGRGEWSGTYSMTVADDTSLSPGVIAESYKREAAAGFDLGRRSILINGTRASSSAGHCQRSCSLEPDGGRYLAEQERGGSMYPTRPYSQLYELDSNVKVTTGPQTRQSSSESEVRLSVGAPEVGPSSTWSDSEPPCVPVGTTAPTGCTGPDAPSKHDSDVVQEGPSSNTQRSSTTFFSWKRRRHSSLDCVFHKPRPRSTTIAAESTAHAKKNHSSEYHGQQVPCNLTIRYSESLPTRFIRDRTVSIVTTTSTTTASTGSRASTGSGSSGASADGNCVPTEARYPSEIHSANTERALTLRRCDKRGSPHDAKTSFKTTLESAMTVPTASAEPNQSPSEAPARGPDAGLFESPRRRVVTSDFNASFRSVRRPTRSPNPVTTDHHVSRSYGSFADVTMTPTMARQMSRLSQKTVRDRRRENSVIFRESKTVKTVSIVIGCFVLCWLPFFVVYITEPFLQTPFDTNPYLKQFVTWLGYFNSVINPFIYAFYNYEFRSTFWQLTIGRLWRGNRRLPRGVAPSSPLNNISRHQKSIRSNSVIVLSKLSAN